MRVKKYVYKEDTFHAKSVHGNSILEKGLGAFEHLAW
jgi:hypothetical protein